MGRPAEFKNRKGITGYLEDKDYQELEEIRWREHKDFSDILRLAVQEYIRNHKEGNDTFQLDDWQTDPNFKAIPTLLGPDDKWSLCFKNSSDEELSTMYVALKKRRIQLITEEIERCRNTDRIPRWKYDKFDMHFKNGVPMLLGDKK